MTNSWPQRDGKSRDFDILVERYRKAILLLAYRITGDRDDASDVAQETFMRAFVRFADREPDDRFGSWLMLVARNASLDCLRRRRARQKYLPMTDRCFAPGPEDVALLDDDASKLRVALCALPPRYRRAVELFYFNGLSYREIGERLGVPLGTVKTLLARGLRKMQHQPTVVELRMTA